MLSHPTTPILFKSFVFLEDAKAIYAKITLAGIPAELVEKKKAESALYVGDFDSNYFELQIAPIDFEKADKVLLEYYAKEVEDLDASYPLFTSSSSELKQILNNPQNNSDLDYALAIKVLRLRGEETPDRKPREEMLEQLIKKGVQNEKANILLTKPYIILAIFLGLLLLYVFQKITFSIL